MTFHACAVILQTHVAVPDRSSNRGVFPGGPETLENLVRVGVLCLGQSGALSQVPEHPDTHGSPFVGGCWSDPIMGCIVHRDGLEVVCVCLWRPQRCGAGSSTGTAVAGF